MKKKLIASLLAATMLLTLSACGGKDSNTADSEPVSATDTEQAADIGTDSETVTDAQDAPEDAAPDNAAPANGIQLYDGSYLDLDGEYASGVPCRRMGGSEIAASDTTVSFIRNFHMDPFEEGYQEDVIAESYQWDVNVTSPTVFVGIPEGAETCWNSYKIYSAETAQFAAEIDAKTEEYKSEGAELMEPGATSNVHITYGPLTGELVTANETSEPIDQYHFSPIILQILGASGGSGWGGYDDDTSGKPGSYCCIGEKAPHSFDDIVAAYGEPVGVYCTGKSYPTYVWKATGDADVYVLVKCDTQVNNSGIEITYIRDCEASKSWLNESTDLANLYDILSELGLYEG